MSDLMEMLMGGGSSKSRNVEAGSSVPAEDQALYLLEFFKEYGKAKFKPGDLITQKDELRRYSAPKPGSPAIVMKVGSVEPQGERDATYNNNDIVIAVKDDHAGIVFFAVESFRFKPFKN